MAGPMIDDVELKAVQWIRQETDQNFVRQKVAGLEGTLHQKLGRRSHRVRLAGLLLPETAGDDLAALQDKAASGAEVMFTADITTALEVERMVIESFAAEQRVGPAGQIAYTIVLAESPPLPPPAEVSPFGGLEGLGDLGFDAGALGDVVGAIQDQAKAAMDAVDAAQGALEQVAALAALAAGGGLADFGNPIKPVSDAVEGLGSLTTAIDDVTRGLGDLLS